MWVNKIYQYLQKRTWILVLILTLAALSFRIFNLGKINSQIFDEVYFVEFAKNYLHGISFFDIHPPLGKLIISLGIKIFGDNSFGWRFTSMVFGTLLIPLMYLTGKELAGKNVGLFAAVITCFDGMMLVYSRLGLMDIYLAFFIVASVYTFLKFSKNEKFYQLVLAGVFLGLATSVKYDAILLWPVLVAIIFIKQIPFKKYLYDYFLALILIPFVIYVGIFLVNFHGADFLRQVLEWHRQSINYNLHLDATHPYASKWWGWFLLWRPIWLYFQNIDGKVVGVDGIGNPLAWWSAIVILPLLIWGTIKKEKNEAVILIGFLLFLLPWALVKRVMFIYTAIPAFIFIVFGISLYLDRLTKIKDGKIVAAIYFALLIGLFIYFLPVWTGIPITPAHFYQRMWFRGWI